MTGLKMRKDGRYCKTVTLYGKRIFLYGTTEEEVITKCAEYQEMFTQKTKHKEPVIAHLSDGEYFYYLTKDEFTALETYLNIYRSKYSKEEGKCL